MGERVARIFQILLLSGLALASGSGILMADPLPRNAWTGSYLSLIHI